MEAAKANAAPSLDRCIVCLAKMKERYLRAELCRACAVFYRRATKTTSSFLCRSATGNCRIDRERIYACAKCRFGRIQKILEKLEKTAKPGPSNALDWNLGPIPDSENYSRYLDEIHPMNVSPSLLRFGRCYNDLCRNRLIIDFGSLKDLPFNDKGKIEAPASYALCGVPTIMRRVQNEMFNFLTAASEEFATMKPEYQTRLMGSFMKQFIPFECFYRSVKHFSAASTNRFYGTFGRYLDSDNVAEYYAEGLADNVFRKEALRILQQGTKNNSEILTPAMAQLRLTDEECLGVTAMLMWNVGHNSDADELNKIAAAKKRAALHDLYMYYKSIGITDYAARLGEIFMFLSLMENIGNESATLMQGLKVLEVFEEELITLLDDQNMDDKHLDDQNLFDPLLDEPKYELPSV